MKKKVPPEVSAYMSRIGTKGNESRTKEMYKNAAKKGWIKRRANLSTSVT